MIIQISSGQGPAECELAVCKCFDSLCKEFPDIREISRHQSRFSDCCTSVMFETTSDLSGRNNTVDLPEPIQTPSQAQKLVYRHKHYPRAGDSNLFRRYHHGEISQRRQRR